jgi:hypothetical protein
MQRYLKLRSGNVSKIMNGKCHEQISKIIERVIKKYVKVMNATILAIMNLQVSFLEAN